MDTKIFSLTIMIILVSFLGFLVENVWLAVTKGYIDNRNMSLPFLLGYGLFIIGLYIFLGTPDTFIVSHHFLNPVIGKLSYFIIVFFIVSIGEIILGFFTEHYFKFYYWNYEKLPMHITRYTSIPTSLGFSSIIMFFMQECFTPLLEFIYSFSEVNIAFIAVLSIIILFGDFILSFKKMHQTHQPNQKWKKYLFEKKNVEITINQ